MTDLRKATTVRFEMEEKKIDGEWGTGCGLIVDGDMALIATSGPIIAAALADTLERHFEPQPEHAVEVLNRVCGDGGQVGGNAVATFTVDRHRAVTLEVEGTMDMVLVSGQRMMDMLGKSLNEHMQKVIMMAGQMTGGSDAVN